MSNGASNGQKSQSKNGQTVEVGLDADELTDIVQNKMRDIQFDVPDETLENLSTANKKALQHLVRAAHILDNVFLKQDHPDNLDVKKAFLEAAEEGDEQAKNALRLFHIFNGLEGIDLYAEESRLLRLAEGKELQPGKGFYPQDITYDELKSHVLKHPEQAAAIFSSNTVVEREAGTLVARPYSVVFAEEMQSAARELLYAAQATDHDGLASHLGWQAQALVNDSDPGTVFNAETSWLKLEDSPLEFTITRERYADRLSSDVAADRDVAKMLAENGIKAKAKDSIGVRVGITNPGSHAEIADYRKHLEAFGRQMPLYELYGDDGQANDNNNLQMSFADIDIVAITGDEAAIRGGITAAQKLPNDDKLSSQLGHGSRLVFHRQVRQQNADPEEERRFLDALVDPAQHELYDKDAQFLFLIGHEFAHMLGPKATQDGRDKKGALGKWGDILEENKADVTSLMMTDYFVNIGKFDNEQARKIYLTWAVDGLPFKKPTEEEAHRFRSIMQLNYFREHGAIEFEKDGKLRINEDKMAGAAEAMLEDVIRLQLDGDAEKAGDFVQRYSQWNDALQYAVDEQNKLKPRRYKFIEQKAAEKVMQLTP